MERLDTVAQTVDYLADVFRDRTRELLVVLCLDARNRLLGEFEVEGGRSAVSIDLGDIFRKMLILRGEALILAHNHPSGCCEASESDVAITRSASNLCRLMGLRCHDHIIFSGSDHYSFREHGLL